MKINTIIALGLFALAAILPVGAFSQEDSEEVAAGQVLDLNPRIGKPAEQPVEPAVEDGKKRKKAEVRLGNIAGTSSAGGVGFVGDTAAGSDETAIGGSVHKVDSNSWMMTVTNNSKDRFSVTVEIAQYDGSGNVAKRLTRSYTLAGGQTKDEKFSVASSIKNCELNLVRAKNLS